MYSMSPKKYPYNNRIISIEGTFFGDTLYMNNKSECFTGISKHEKIVFECLDIPVRHELEMFIQGVSKKTQPRNFPRNRHCFKDKRF